MFFRKCYLFSRLRLRNKTTKRTLMRHYNNSKRNFELMYKKSMLYCSFFSKTLLKTLTIIYMKCLSLVFKIHCGH